MSSKRTNHKHRTSTVQGTANTENRKGNGFDVVQSDEGSDERRRLESEARYWRKWAMKNGRLEWEKAKGRISKLRGKAGLKKLVDEMNRQYRQTK
jgi:hypothetical protein